MMWMSFIGVLAITSQAWAQFSPDPRMTKNFKDRMQVLKSSHTKVFVSDCDLSAKGKDKAVLAFAFGSSTGTLALVSEGNIYNGAGVRFENDRAVLEDPGGGEWSQRRLSGITDQLVKFPFVLMQPNDVTALFSKKSSNECVEPAGRPNS
jgi:hypothetical protein